jgi:hypothetical protein
MRLNGPEDGLDDALEIQRAVGSKLVFITGCKEPETITRIRTVGPTAILFMPIAGDQQLSQAPCASSGASRHSTA